MRAHDFLFFGAITLLLPLGCGADDDDGDDGADTGGSGSESTSTDPTTESMSGPTSASASMTASDSGTEDSTSASETGTATTEGTTGPDTGGSESETTVGTDECVGLDRMECMENPGCAPIGCNIIEPSTMGGAGFCIGDVEFIGCQAADIACAEVITFACMGDDAPIYQCPNACIPADWLECNPPADNLEPC